MLFKTYLMQYVEWQRKWRKGKHKVQGYIYSKTSTVHSLTASSNIWIMERELTLGKISVLLFISLKYGV